MNKEITKKKRILFIKVLFKIKTMKTSNGYALKCRFGSETWFKIGELIYLFSEGSREGYNLWLTYSATDAEKYDEERCYNRWHGFDYVLED